MKLFKLVAGYIMTVTFVMGLVVSNAAVAQTEQEAPVDARTPHAVIDDLAKNILTFLKTNKDQLQTEPTAFYDEIENIVTPSLNLDYIAKKVMGAYWSKATPEQREKFQTVFARSMIVTYGKGMANYADLDVKVLPPTKPVPDAGGFVVVQEITTTGVPEKVVYFMGKRPGARWQIINVVYEGVNLRDTSQGQFAQLASEKKGDIDAVIASWKSAE